MITGVLYRYEDIRYAPRLDEYDIGEDRVEVLMLEFPVIRKTPKGVWINLGHKEKFVRLSAKKLFACPTKDAARTSFIARKERQIGLLSAQIDTAKKALKLIMMEGAGQ